MHRSHSSPLLLPAAAIFATSWLAGCVTTERPASKLVVPSSWQHKSIGRKPLDSAALAQWWTRFGDSTLDRLIATAFEFNTDVRSGLARIEESRAQRGVTKSALLPSIGASASPRVDWSRTNSRETSSDIVSTGIDASWEIDLFGKLRQDLHASDADLAETEENLDAIRVSLAAEVADAYVTLRAAETRLAVYRRNVTTSEETADMTRWQEQAGEGTALSTQQAKSSVEQARAAIPTIQQTIEQTRNRLALLAGLTPGSLDNLLGSSGSIPLPPSSLSAGIPADVLRQRPDVRAAEWALAAAAARTKSAEKEQLPSLTLSGSLGVEALSTGAIFSPETVAANAIGQLTAPIFQGGRIRDNIHLQSAQEKQALIAWEATVLTALSEVEDALIAVRRTSERLGILKVAVTSAREAEQLARLNYEAGQIDLLDVLVAQRTLLSLEESRAIALGDQASAHIQLYKTLGGGWSR